MNFVYDVMFLQLLRYFLIWDEPSMIMYRKINKKNVYTWKLIRIDLIVIFLFFFSVVFRVSIRFSFFSSRDVSWWKRKCKCDKRLDFSARVTIIVIRIGNENTYATRCSYFEEMIVSEVKRKKIKSARYLWLSCNFFLYIYSTFLRVVLFCIVSRIAEK